MSPRNIVEPNVYDEAQALLNRHLSLIATNSESCQDLLYFLQEKTNQAERDVKGVMGNPIIMPQKAITE
jgi:hypothetical protein